MERYSDQGKVWKCDKFLSFMSYDSTRTHFVRTCTCLTNQVWQEALTLFCACLTGAIKFCLQTPWTTCGWKDLVIKLCLWSRLLSFRQYMTERYSGQLQVLKMWQIFVISSHDSTRSHLVHTWASLTKSGVTGGGLDPYNVHALFVNMEQHVDGKIWKLQLSCSHWKTCVFFQKCYMSTFGYNWPQLWHLGGDYSRNVP